MSFETGNSQRRKRIDQVEAEWNRQIPDFPLRPRAQVPLLEEVLWIAQQEMAILREQDSFDYLGSPHFRSCSLLTLWNPESRICAAFHVGNKTCVADTIEQVRTLTENGYWQVRLVGGSSHGVPQERLGGHRYCMMLSFQLYQFCKDTSQRDFLYSRPTGLSPTSANDCTFLFDKATGELSSLSTARICEEERLGGRRLGPHFIERMHAANLYPHFAYEAYPCVLAYEEGVFTDARPPSTPALERTFALLRREFQMAQTDEDFESFSRPEFLSLLRKYVPDNEYLIGRCESESGMWHYIQEQLLIHWELKEPYPVAS